MIERPDIFLIVLDSLRADRLGCYGYRKADTRHLDRFAARAARFDQAITPGYWTLPSHGSLFTGLYPSEHGATRVGHSLPPDAGTTMAQALSEAGYYTFAVSNNPNVSEPLGFARGFDEFIDAWREHRRSRGKLSRVARALGRGDTGASATNSLVSGLLRARKEPLFCFLLYMETHAPYRPRWTSPRRSLSAPLAVWRMLPVYRRIAEWGEVLRSHPHLYPLVSDLYDGELAYLDRRIGGLLSDIEDARGLDNCVVMVTSDHGECLGQHGLASHGRCLYDSLLHVPLIVSWPGGPKGHVVASQVQLNDIWPSLARWLGLPHPVPHRADGRPSVMRSGAAEADVPAFAEIADGTGLQAVRANGYKYLEGDGAPELYDLSADPGEEVNVSGEKGEVLEQMKQLLGQWRESLRPYAGDASASVEDEALAERLRALGYLS